MFANLIRWSEDKQTRILVGLVIGLHWVDTIKPIFPDAVMIWEKLEQTKPNTVHELKNVILDHCRDMVRAVYWLALDTDEFLLSIHNQFAA